MRKLVNAVADEVMNSEEKNQGRLISPALFTGLCRLQDSLASNGRWAHFLW